MPRLPRLTGACRLRRGSANQGTGAALEIEDNSVPKGKPFLLLSSRAHDPAADGEFLQVLQVGSLEPHQLDWRRLEQAPLGEFDLDNYSGVLLGGSDYCASETDKSELQLRVEADMDRVLGQALARDFPFLGMCYGIGIVTQHLGGKVDKTYSEAVGAVEVTLTKDGQADPLLQDCPDSFWAFVGHKEAANGTPPGATILATGQACPVQIFRVGRNVYASQFHPELDAAGLAQRIIIYQHSGYFRPDEVEALIAAAEVAPVNGAQHLLLANFIRYHLVD